LELIYNNLYFNNDDTRIGTSDNDETTIARSENSLLLLQADIINHILKSELNDVCLILQLIQTMVRLPRTALVVVINLQSALSSGHLRLAMLDVPLASAFCHACLDLFKIVCVIAALYDYSLALHVFARIVQLD
jgi:hypothetical protein